jgi:hypothetical protein
MTVVDRSAPSVTFGVPSATVTEAATASAPKPAAHSMFLIGGLLVGVMLAPLARIALRR